MVMTTEPDAAVTTSAVAIAVEQENQPSLLL
jgi:hypothetical protein